MFPTIPGSKLTALPTAVRTLSVQDSNPKRLSDLQKTMIRLAKMFVAHLEQLESNNTAMGEIHVVALETPGSIQTQIAHLDIQILLVSQLLQYET